MTISFINRFATQYASLMLAFALVAGSVVITGCSKEVSEETHDHDHDHDGHDHDHDHDHSHDDHSTTETK